MHADMDCIKSKIPFGNLVNFDIHWSKQLKDQPVLLLSSFMHNCSINEHKNMKLRENTYYEKIN